MTAPRSRPACPEASLGANPWGYEYRWTWTRTLLALIVAGTLVMGVLVLLESA